MKVILAIVTRVIFPDFSFPFEFQLSLFKYVFTSRKEIPCLVQVTVSKHYLHQTGYGVVNYDFPVYHLEHSAKVIQDMF